VKGGVLPNDPWGKPYIYRSPGERSAYEIISYGSDGQEGGTGIAADISTASNE
jgi:general secretion pathway protein G